MIRVAAVASAVLALAACSQGGGEQASSSDPYAGHEALIASWRTDIEASHPVCQRKVSGQGCETFQVTCKAAQTITPEEQAKGVTAKLVAAMTFAARSEDGSAGKPGSAFATLSNTNGQWTRAESGPVNLTTCAPV